MFEQKAIVLLTFNEKNVFGNTYVERVVDPFDFNEDEFFQINEPMQNVILATGELYCEFGIPDTRELKRGEIFNRVMAIRQDRVCGVLTNFRFELNPNLNKMLLADFRTFGPLAEHIPAINKIDFSLRSIQSPGRQVTHIVAWDVILK